MAAPMAVAWSQSYRGILSVRRILASGSPTVIHTAGYAKKPGGVGGTTGKLGAGGKGVGVGAAPQKKRLEPETDPTLLVSRLCGANISCEGGEDPPLRPRDEYPAWLWTLRTERGAVDLDEIEPDSWAYWRRLHKLNRKRNMLILQNKYRYNKF